MSNRVRDRRQVARKGFVRNLLNSIRRVRVHREPAKLVPS
jgi:hypothetical protein